MASEQVVLSADPPTQHGPTRALLIALRDNGWSSKWQHGGTAMLVHGLFGHLEIEIDPDNTDRVITLIDGRQVPHRVAMQRARGEV